MIKNINLSLSKLSGGEVEAKFKSAIKQVVQNLQDGNTDFRASREITIKLTFTNSVDKEDIIDMQADVKTKLAPPIKSDSSIFISHDMTSGDVNINELADGVKGQMAIDIKSGKLLDDAGRPIED